MTSTYQERSVMHLINNLTFDQYITFFGNIVENSRFIAATVWSFRPFRSLQNFKDNVEKILDSLPIHGESFSQS